MVKDLLKYRLVFFFALTAFLVNCANAQTISNQMDLSTDEAVIAELQKIRDAKDSISSGDERLDAKRRAANKLETRDVCIERLKETPKIIVVAFFRYDYGCHFAGAFIDSRFYNETGIFDAAKPTLESFGWQKTNEKGRERLALFWVEKILHVFDEVFYPNRMNPPQNGGAQPPATDTEANGDVIVTLWIQPPPDRTGKKDARRFEYKFKPDGSLARD